MLVLLLLLIRYSTDLLGYSSWSVGPHQALLQSGAFSRVISTQPRGPLYHKTPQCCLSQFSPNCFYIVKTCFKGIYANFKDVKHPWWYGVLIFCKRNKVPCHRGDEYLEVICSASSGRSDFNHPRKAFLYPFLTNFFKKRKKEKATDIFPYYFKNHCLVFQFGKMKSVLEMDGSDGYTRTWMYLMSLNYTLKIG